MRWESFTPSVDANMRTEPRPDWLLIQLGSNDICLIKSKELIENIKSDVLRLHALFPNLKFIWSEILPRRYWHFAEGHKSTENTRKRVNKAVRKIFLEDIPLGYAIRHPNIKEKERSLYRHDGCHMSDIGNDIYLQNIQAGFETFITSGKRVFPDIL